MWWKNKFFIGFITIAILSISIGFSFSFIHEEDNSIKEENKEKEIPKKEEKKDIKVLESITINIKDEIPSIEKFINEENIENYNINYKDLKNKKIYLNNKKIEDNKNIAYSNNKLKEGFSEKTIVIKSGKFNIIIRDEINDLEYESIIIVKDDEAPKLELKKVTIKEFEKYEINDFVKSCTDNSDEECVVFFADEKMGNYKDQGNYNIVIIAKDNDNNEIKKDITLIINEKEKEENNKKETKKEDNINKNDDEKEEIITESQIKEEENNNENYNVVNEEETKIIEKYGTKIITVYNVTYHVYNDGSKKEIERISKGVSYDKTTYNGNTNILLADAKFVPNNEVTSINRILENVNAYRAEVGVAPLVLDYNLSVAASVRALELGYWQYHSGHLRPDGSQCFTVLSDLNYKFQTAGENIAKGFGGSADLVSEGWKNSPGHYANMIDPSFTKIGISLVKTDTYYWVQMFAG